MKPRTTDEIAVVDTRAELSTGSWSRPRRVLYVVPRFPWINTTFIANEMHAVAALGVDVRVFSVWRSNVDVPNVLEEPFLHSLVVMPVHHPRVWLEALKTLAGQPGLLLLLARLLVGHLRSPLLPLKLAASAVKALALARWCVVNRIDHIHAHFLTSPTTVGLLASAATGISFSFTAHAFDFAAKDWRAVNGAIPLKWRRAAAQVTVARANVDYLKERWAVCRDLPPTLIYNGIDTALFSPGRSPRPRAARTPWRIVCVGSLVPKKGHAVLLRAVAQVRRLGHEVELDIFGRGRLERRLRGLIRSLQLDGIVRLRRAKPVQDLVDEYRSADLFALACVEARGDVDGIPTVILEALAMEVPCISTRIGGIPEVLQDRVTGRCVTSGSAEEMADAIVWTLENYDTAKVMARRGRQLVLERFDGARNAARLVELWRRIAAERAQA